MQSNDLHEDQAKLHLSVRYLFKSQKYKVCFLLALGIAVAGCSSLNSLSMMGVINKGVYTQPYGNFSCSLSAEPLGLRGAPLITDAVRITKTEDIPLSQRSSGDWRKTKIVSDEIHASRVVKFEDSSGTLIEISSGKRIHPAEMVLNSGMSGGVSWRFARREMSRASGRMMTGLMLVPWHEENDVYMGINAAKSYKMGQGPDARLWILSNIVIDKVVHTVTIKLPIAALVTPGVNVRDLHAIRDDISSRPELQEALFSHANNWLTQCHFSAEI